MKRFTGAFLCSVVVCLSFVLGGCSTKVVDGEQTSPSKQSKPVQGRWLMDGQAGKAMVESVNQADHSIIVISRAFVVEENSITQRLADRLIERAREGVEVTILLPNDFIPYFNDKNRKTRKFFRNTPVEIKLEQAQGNLGTDNQFNRGRENYVSSALVLVDGTDLFAGSFILDPGVLTSDNNTIAQFRGPGIYGQVVPKVSTVLTQHNMDTGIKEPGSNLSTEELVEWREIMNFQFYLGRTNTGEMLSRRFREADTSVKLSAWTVGNIRSDRVHEIFDAILSWPRRLTIDRAELFYSSCERKLCAVHSWVDRELPAYEYDEPEDQYHRFGLIDDRQFYTGTYDLWEVSLWGRHYETLVLGRSEGMVSDMNTWLDARRSHSKPVHKRWTRFTIAKKNSHDSASKRGSSARIFLQETVLPAVEENNWDSFVQILDEQSADNVAWSLHKAFTRNLKSDTGAPAKIYESFRDHSGIKSAYKADSEGKNLLRPLIEQVVRKNPYFSVIARQTVFKYLEDVLVDMKTPYLVEYEQDYRIYQPDRTALDGDFRWSIWLVQKSGDWMLSL